ncbi:hypothetical protein [Pseudomonas sp.]|uniref:hypothetical protein n=1 Tax=Pseudomonas sp. TaxID=306 RepID=UPI0025877280|nr:hypothetical protein [Pseudomonas sp.]
MSRVNQTPRLSRSDPALERLLREQAAQINRIAEGRISAFYSAATAAPTGGTWAQGDFVRNSAPSEVGTAGSKYLIHGWQCVAGGTPGTWLECRYLTGN